jgi:hypothetical protein
MPTVLTSTPTVRHIIHSTCARDCESQVPDPTASVYETCNAWGPNAGGVGMIVGKVKPSKRKVKRGKKLKVTVTLVNTAVSQTYERLNMVMGVPAGVLIQGQSAKPALKPAKKTASGFKNPNTVTWSGFFMKRRAKQSFTISVKVTNTAAAPNGVLPFTATLTQTAFNGARVCPKEFGPVNVDLVA